jgi:hypothetical protein
LLDQVRESNTDTVSVDPDIADDVNLNVVGFADKAAAVKIILNPNSNGGFRLQISFFDRVGQTIPNLVFYDFEFVPHETLVDLNRFHFADKAAFVRVERGPDFRQGDRILLLDTVQGGGATFPIEPTTEPTIEVNLNDVEFADRAAAVRFDF